MKPVEDSVIGRTVLGRYRIVRTLARGGMGAVYLGRTEGAEGFARPVVVKRVLPTLMGDPEIAQLFVREARILANLQHPNIVAVVDFGQSDGAYVTVFEYVNGYSLAEYRRFLGKAHEQISIDIALHIVGRVLDALEYAHTLRRNDRTPLQIVHRDVSPSNILLSEQGTIKLLDFGIAQMSGEPVESHTERPRIRGKLPYVPLELFKGAPATVQSDVYAAGVVLYELITGTNPFFGREVADIFDKVANVTPPSVHAVREDAPEDIDSVLARALDRDPKRRYRSAAEFAAALRPLRREPEDQVARQLAERLRRDFATAVPEALGLEPLAVREAAWRNSKAPEPSTEAASEWGATFDVELRASVAPQEAVTVHADVSPEMLAGAIRQSEPAHAAGAVSRPDSIAPEPERAPPTSTRRLAWLAGLSALVGGVAAAMVWLAVDRAPAQPVVVVERSMPAQAAGPAMPAPPPAPIPVVPTPPPAQASAVAPAADTIEPSANAAAEARTTPAPKSDPPAPNPRALTRAFTRRQKHVEACFDRHAAVLEGQPQLSLHFRVGASGDVLGVELEPTSLADTALGRCLLEVAHGTRFNPQQRDVSFHIPITAQAMLDAHGPK
jgi:serine/threonine protein kinase